MLFIYGFFRLSSEGEARLNGSKMVITTGIIVMAFVALFESWIFWNWYIQHTPQSVVNIIFIWSVSMMIASPFFILLMFDLAVQWFYMRRKSKQVVVRESLVVHAGS